MSGGWSVVDVDESGDPEDRIAVGRTPGASLVVVRRDGVPIGSALLEGPSNETAGEVLARVERRPDAPPGVPGRNVRLSVAVCTKDRPEMLARCLSSVQAAFKLAGDEIDGEVVVVDNASADARTADVAIAAGARCVREEVPGLDVARNAAVAAATGDIIAFVDDDVVVDLTWARTLVRSLAVAPEAVAITGQVRALRLDTAARVAFERSGGFSLGWDPITFVMGETPGVPFGRSLGVGCNMAFRADALARIGSFDEALDTGRPLPGAGDTDILVRALATGPVRYEPSAVVFHDHRATFDALRYQFYSWGKAYAVLLVKWYRAAPERRPELRREGTRRLRSYGRDILEGRRHRRVDAVLMAVGFIAGCAGSYGRSQRRMARRRAEAGTGRGR